MEQETEMARPKVEKQNPKSTKHGRTIRVDKQVVAEIEKRMKKVYGDTPNRVLRRVFGLDKES